MGQIVGAALVSHHPGLMQCEDFRLLQGAGSDSDLIAGYGRLRVRISAVKPDLVLIFDSHWRSTGYHLVDGGAHYQGQHLSDDMPWYVQGVPYDYMGYPAFALACESVARESSVPLRALCNPLLARHDGSINVIKQLRLDVVDLPVVSVSCCSNAEPVDYLASGAVIGEVVRRSDLRVLVLASGALSHCLNPLDFKPRHARSFHEDNVASLFNMAADKQALTLMQDGRHSQLIDSWDSDYRGIPWEASGAHYLQMLGALGGHACRAKGTALSDYENALGTGNIHMWFDV